VTYAPATLLTLREYLKPLTGLSSPNLGIVGDARHVAVGQSYHLGANQLVATAYSRRTARDRAGLTNAASALDIGNHGELRQLSRWLVSRARVNARGTDDIREIIYSPDGVKVLRWDRERGFNSAPREGEADDSHRWHTHISWYRDAEYRDKRGVFAPFYDDTSLPDTSTGGGDMPGVRATPFGPTIAGIFRVGSTDGLAIPIIGGTRTPIGAGATRHAVGPYTIDAFSDPTRLFYIVTEDGAPAFVAATLGTFSPLIPSSPDCTAAIAADRARARIVYE
jgi:hypothetical protein